MSAAYFWTGDRKIQRVKYIADRAIHTIHIVALIPYTRPVWCVVYTHACTQKRRVSLKISLSNAPASGIIKLSFSLCVFDPIHTRNNERGRPRIRNDYNESAAL